MHDDGPGDVTGEHGVAHEEHTHHGHEGHYGHLHGHRYERRPWEPVNELAIVGVITAVLFWPVGLFTSLVARREVRKSGERGEGLAVIGIVISALSGLLWSILFLALLVGATGIGGQGWGHDNFGFVHQGTIMRVSPVQRTGPCNPPLSVRGGASITCSNGTYVNPGGPLIPAPTTGGSGAQSSTSSGGAVSSTQ